MTRHEKNVKRLKSKIHNAILDCGETDGADGVALKNTDVVDALLELTGLYCSIHGFETYSRTDLAFKHALTIMEHIEAFQEMRKEGKMPATVVPRNKVN